MCWSFTANSAVADKLLHRLGYCHSTMKKHTSPSLLGELRHTMHSSGPLAQVFIGICHKKTNVWPCYCYNSFACFLSCFLLFNYVYFICFSISFSSCAALLFIHSLMHSTLTHAQSCTVLHSLAQSCTVCLLMYSLLRCSLVTQYIRTVWTVVFCS